MMLQIVLFVFFEYKEFAEEIVGYDNHNLTYKLCDDNIETEDVNEQPDNCIFHPQCKETACRKGKNFAYITFEGV